VLVIVARQGQRVLGFQHDPGIGKKLLPARESDKEVPLPQFELGLELFDLLAKLIDAEGTARNTEE
jgi:hypothetical protein